LSTRGYVLSANAALTLSSSTSGAQDSLVEVFKILGENDPNTTRQSSTGHYVTQFGDKRIVWQPEDESHIKILTIYSPST
jgi:hypothetical protein